MQIDQVLDEYRKGNADVRISLFLSYRELRDEFARIEEDDPADLQDAGFSAEPERRGMVRRVVDMLRDRSMRPAPGASCDRIGP